MVMEMSKTYQYRKVMKPLLERKRRARINKCLDDLKDLVVECLQQDGEHVTRLEKADILELTVELMRKLKQRGKLSLSTTAQPNLQIESFRSGYVHAADQITQVLLQQQQTDEVGQKVVKFLSSRLVELQNQLLGATTSPVIPPPTAMYIPLPTAITTNPVHVTTLSANIGAESYSFMDSDCSSEADESVQGRSRSQSINGDLQQQQQQQLIDVTTVEEKVERSPPSSEAGESSDSHSEPVWRPW